MKDSWIKPGIRGIATETSKITEGAKTKSAETGKALENAGSVAKNKADSVVNAAKYDAEARRLATTRAVELVGKVQDIKNIGYEQYYYKWCKPLGNDESLLQLLKADEAKVDRTWYLEVYYKDRAVPSIALLFLKDRKVTLGGFITNPDKNVTTNDAQPN
ncbi:MAG: hypothetical protein M1355_02830 [Patescibacteria group bacterium]|nr:hypothetical protein [Patescibacteria group bacterium]